MNIFAPTLLISAMAISWSWQNFSDLSWRDYDDVETGLEQFIGQYIEQNLPEASDLQFYDFKTQAVDESQIRVFFEYSFLHPLKSKDSTEDTSLRLRGSTILTKKIEHNSNSGKPDEYWQMGEIEISEESISFVKELSVTVSD